MKLSYYSFSQFIIIYLYAMHLNLMQLYIYIIASNLSLEYLEFIATKIFVAQIYYLKFYYNTLHKLLQ